MLWDRGTWTPEVDDVDAALKKGDLKFTLNGYKLKGSWVLVRTGGRYRRRAQRVGRHRSWLLIKHRDEWAGELDITEFAPQSVKSDGDFEDILGGDTPAVWRSNRPGQGRRRRRDARADHRARGEAEGRAQRARRRRADSRARARDREGERETRKIARSEAAPRAHEDEKERCVTTCCDAALESREQPPREHAPHRVGEPQAIVPGDVARPELPADQLAVRRAASPGASGSLCSSA